jgi:hypothetical protein
VRFDAFSFIHHSKIYSQASAKEAQDFCKDRNMNLASFEKALESDMVTDFIGALGIYYLLNFFQFKILVLLRHGQQHNIHVARKERGRII